MHVRYKIFLAAIEYLPFSAGDDSKGSFEEIIERYTYFLKNIFVLCKVSAKDAVFQPRFIKSGSYVGSILVSQNRIVGS